MKNFILLTFSLLFCSSIYAQHFISTWETTTANESITIPTTGSGYNYSVNWGDGTFDLPLTGDATHTYATAGTYTVAILGSFPRISFNNQGDKDKIKNITQWGSIGWTSMNGAFLGCTNLQVSATDAPDLSLVTSLYQMFGLCFNFNSNINHWNVNTITDMYGLFFEVFNFNQPLNNWNVSNVTYMGEMFFGASSFNQDISMWNTRKVTDMKDVFNGATAFNQDLSTWDLSSVTAMDRMFTNAGLSTTNYDATLIGWATDSSGTPNDGTDDIPTNIIFDGGNRTYCSSINQRQNLIDTYNWTITDAGLNTNCTEVYFISTWETTTANESITIPTIDSGYNYTVNWGDGTSSTHTADATHTYTTAGTHTVSISGSFPRIYFNNTGDKDKIKDITQWGTIAWTSMNGAFYGCHNLQVSATDAPDLSNVTNLGRMFLTCGIFNSNINHWDVSTITEMTSMIETTAFNQPLNNWDVSNVTSMGSMLRNTPFNQPLNNWNVSNVIDMVGIFFKASSFNQDISMWNTRKVTDMKDVFNGATAFNQDLSAWDLSSVTTMDRMFTNAGLSTTNYDATLIGWATDSNFIPNDGTDDIPTNIIFDGGNSTYCSSTNQRQNLIDTHNWTIIDAGVDTTNCTETFKTVWETTTANESITIPTTDSGYNYTVNWGDGTSTTHTADATHTYTTAGTYTVSISGSFPRVYFNNQGDKDKIKDITQWGSIAWTSMNGAFLGCTNLQVSATDAPDLSNVTSLYQMFGLCFNFNSNINHWNVNTITDMDGLFFAVLNFNQPLNNWDVSNVTGMRSMFRNTSFNQPLNNWNVSNVIDMGDMFFDASSFNQDISMWNTRKVTDMKDVFNGATAFNQDLSAWDLSSVTAMDRMFTNAGLSTTNYDATLIGWATDSNFIPNDGTGDIPTNITFGGGFSTYCTSTNQRQDLIDTYNWSITDAGVDTTNCTETFKTVWETTTANESITIPTKDSGYNYTVNWGDGTSSTTHTGDATHTYTTAGMHTVSISGSFPRIHFNHQGDRDKIKYITQWGSIAWTSMRDSFWGCTNLQVSATDAPDLSNVTSLWGMFAFCTNFNSNINHWDVSNVINMPYTFYGATAFNQPLNNWNVSNNVTSMFNMFRGATAFNQPLNNWNVSNVTIMREMFFQASDFNQDISMWNTHKVSNMKDVFNGATAFNQDLSTWDLSSVTEMDRMFTNAGLSTINYDATLIGWATDSSGTPNDGTDDIPTNITFDGGNSTYCTSINQRQNLIDTYNWTITDAGLDANCAETFKTVWETTTLNESITIPTIDSGYNYTVNWGDGTNTTHTGDATHTYTTAGTYIVSIGGSFPRIYFNNQGDKSKIKYITQWGSIAWTSMSGAFWGCTNLQVSATGAPDLSNVTSLASMFRTCTNFNGNINHWDVSTITEMNTMFFNASLFNQPLNNWNVSNVTTMLSMFRDATAFNQPLNNWNVSNVTNMAELFLRVSSFNQDISMWNTHKVTDMAKVFNGATAFNQDLNAWDLSSVTIMEDMFASAGLSTTNYDNTLIGWAIDSSGTANDGVDDKPTNITFGGGNSTYCTSINQRQDLIDTYNWTITDAGLDANCAETFKTVWETTTLNESITIPTIDNGYNYTVHWGDGTSTTHTADATHIYTLPGTYTVSIGGSFPRIFFNDGGDKTKIKYITQWGSIVWASMRDSFWGCTNLQVSATDAPDLSNVKSLWGMFAFCTNFNNNINHWDVSNVINMPYTFYRATAFNQPLNNWDVSNITNMISMFRDATAFNQPLNNWNVSNVNMREMFFQASDFNQDISMWNTHKVTNMKDVFNGASAFDQDLGAWDLSSVAAMDRMFTNAGLSTTNYDATLIGWATDSSGTANDDVDDIPSNIIFDGGNSTYCTSINQRQNLIDTYNWSITDAGLDPNCTTDILISPKVYLQGASLNPNTGEESLMRDDLRVAGLIPTTSPYTDALIVNTSVFTPTGNDAIVDWVWVELRDATNNTVIIASQSALLQRDGDVVGLDGVSALSFTQSAGDYYVAVAHRNHLGIISASTIALSSTTTVVDFSNGDVSTFGANAQTISGMPIGTQGLWSGDVNGDSIVQYSGGFPDVPAVLSFVLNDTTNFLNLPTYSVTGYSNYDIDMNGTTQYTGSNPEPPIILQNVLVYPSNFLNLITFPIETQLPTNVMPRFMQRRAEFINSKN